MHRRIAALMVTALAVVALVGLDATPAFAHAILQGSDPSTGATVTRAPKMVTLRFDESVAASLGAIKLFDSRGNRVDVGAPFHPGGTGSQVAASLPSLSGGTYVVTWRVISADSHPVRGAFTFGVGNGGGARDVTGLVSRLLTQEGGSTATGVLYGLARFAVFASLALLIGGVALVAFVWPEGRASRRAARMIWGAWIAALLASLAAFALQGAYAAALTPSGALHLTELRAVWHTRFGHVSVLRIVLLVAAAGLLRPLLWRRPVAEYPLPSWWAPAAGVVGIALAATPGLGGHAATGRWTWFAMPADVVHVAAMSLWLGGLTLLAVCVLPVPDPPLLRRVVPRFSTVALTCIVAIVVSGSFQAWRQVGSLHALTTTDYGRLLLVKLAGVALILVGAKLSRDVVDRRLRRAYAAPVLVTTTVGAPVGTGGSADDSSDHDVPVAGGAGAVGDDDEWTDDVEWTAEDEERAEVRRLRLSVGFEVVMGVLVLAVTALLVNAAPAYSTSNAPFAKTVAADGRFYDLSVTPSKVGPNDVHITAVTRGGGPADVLKYTVTFSEPGKGIAPINVPVLRLGPGHYASYGFQVPFPGTWKMTVKALITNIDETTFTVDVHIR
jgi:copper transport protein